MRGNLPGSLPPELERNGVQRQESLQRFLGEVDMMRDWDATLDEELGAVMAVKKSFVPLSWTLQERDIEELNDT